MNSIFDFIKDKISYNFILLVTIVLLALISIVFIFTTSARQSKNMHIFKQTQSQVNINQSIVLPQETTLVANIDYSNLHIPILMYHHIRDYSVPTDPIGNNLSVSPADFSAQLDYIASLGYETTTFLAIKAGNIPEKPIILTFDDGYLNFYENAYPELRRRHMVAVSYIITKNNGDMYMDNAKIKEISDYGIEVGSHTISHPDLSRTNTEQARHEITASKAILEGIIKKTVVSFCYPSGKFNEETISLVRSAGYDFATTTKSGVGDFSKLLEISRYRMNSDTNIKAYLK